MVEFMRRLNPYYVPAAVVVLVSLLIGTVAIYAAPATTLTGTVPVCAGINTSSAQVVLAGRVITPSTIIRAGPCASNEAGYNLFSYANTILVSPQAGANETQNGTAILTALNSITNASASNPYLLQIEPGVYDLGTNNLTMKPYVDLQGSGENVTQISAAASGASSEATLIGSNNSEVRDLTVTNRGGAGYAQAILAGAGINNSFKVNRVTINAGNGSTYSAGIFNNQGSPLIQNSTIAITSTATSTCYGINNSGNAALIINNRITVNCNANNSSVSYGIYSNNSSVVSLQNNLINVSNSGVGDTYGIRNDGSTGTIETSSINITTTASGGGYGVSAGDLIGGSSLLANSYITVTAGFGYALQNNGVSSGTNYTMTVHSSVVTVSSSNSSSGSAVDLNNKGYSYIQNSTIIALPSVGGSYGAINIANAFIDSSNLKGGNYSIFGLVSGGNPPTTNVGSSKLEGNIGAGGTFKCVSSYNASYTALSSTCS